ncbi:TPA: hypothetical protein ACX1L3_000976 [Listeria monocytogenes]|uniref:hypothetical protein n=1 Tax=Listeria monocytogenes TaxID=1639 RepID=UPI000EBCA5D9|nr:hypothetical protein [Listeria monocytogenes]EAC3591521.1 hypothetical protein [Listeria monocytogenes]EAC5876869.1 hypothetical protein [Listeria monocytogenes]EAC6773279.1 hypothetical protein [Listeria monocytogenes]EAD4831852.1 hypothetical protein [Listeria monocytogenes]EAD9694822.1 hypothetical protein [Listeria monocytogenes]
MTEQEAKAIVLEWLTGGLMNYAYPTDLLKELALFEEPVPSKVLCAYRDLNTKSEYELLAEFAAWGLKEDAKG